MFSVWNKTKQKAVCLMVWDQFSYRDEGERCTRDKLPSHIHRESQWGVPCGPRRFPRVREEPPGAQASSNPCPSRNLRMGASWEAEAPRRRPR